MQKPGFSVPIWILLLFCASLVHAQEYRTEVCFEFRVRSTTIDSAYSDNAARMRKIRTFLQNVRQDSTTRIVNVSFRGAASPEGSYQLNHKLARGRLSAIEHLIRQEVDIPDSLITRDDSYIPWDYLKSQVKCSDLQGRDSVLAILEEEARLTDYHHAGTHIDNRIVKLKRLDGGRIWQEINRLYFARMRNACAVIVTYRREIPPVREPITVSTVTEVEPEPAIATVRPMPTDTMTVAHPIIPAMEKWHRHLYLKTNVLGWGLAIANVAVEADLAKHWSLTLPVYYSAWDYFKSTVKFRTFAIQPELRYWPSERNDGFFAGAHFGLAYYNLATAGDYRYQDHKRRSPAPGGGLSVGYRLPISKNDRWHVEFALGAGVYSLHYDKFHNTPHTKEGLMVETVKKNYLGIDQAAVSFSYTFDLKRKGGRK